MNGPFVTDNTTQYVPINITNKIFILRRKANCSAPRIQNVYVLRSDYNWQCALLCSFVVWNCWNVSRVWNNKTNMAQFFFTRCLFTIPHVST